MDDGRWTRPEFRFGLIVIVISIVIAIVIAIIWARVSKFWVSHSTGRSFIAGPELSLEEIQFT